MNALLLFLALPLCAQQRPLATNHDGSVLLFAQEGYRPANAPSDFQFFLYAIENGAFRVFRQSKEERLRNPDLSGDGSVRSWLAGLEPPRTVSTIEGLPAGLTRQTDQVVRLSSNGRFAIRFDHTSNAYRWYLDSGRITYLSGRIASSNAEWQGRLVAADGTAVLGVGNEVRLFPKDSTDEVYRTLTTFGIMPSIDDAATTVVWSRGGTLGWELRSLLTGVSVIFPGELPILSADGRRVLASVSPDPSDSGSRQAWLYQLGGGFEQIPAPPGFSFYTLSGDGRIVWYMAADGIHRLIVDSNKLELALPWPLRYKPEFSPFPAVPGSLYSLFIEGLENIATRTAATPLPTELETFRVLLDDVPAPIHSVATRRFDTRGESWTEVRFQVPWSLPSTGSVRVSLQRGGNALAFGNLVAAPPPLILKPFFPTVVSVPDRPLRPGEMFRMLMTGLGAVSPAVPTGSGGSSPVIRRLDCTLWIDEETLPVSVISATLIPGQAGVYQVTAQLPSSLPPGGETWISCDSLPVPLPLAP